MENVYPKIREQILNTDLYRESKKAFLLQMQQAPVGLYQQRPSQADTALLMEGKTEEFLSSHSVYAIYLTRLTALEDASYELRTYTGTSGFTDVMYLPVSYGVKNWKEQEELVWGEQLKECRNRQEVRQLCQERYGLAEAYEIETALEGEVNFMLEAETYRKVFVAGKLEVAMELAG